MAEKRETGVKNSNKQQKKPSQTIVKERLANEKVQYYRRETAYDLSL